jgi:hypothetical protein
MQKIIDFIQGLNFSYSESVIGAHFNEIVALMSIVFGGSLMLFGWKEKNYFLAVIGGLVGAWGGLLLRTVFLPESKILPFIYIIVFAIVGAVATVFFRRFTGMLLGGFIAICVAITIFPKVFMPGKETYIATALCFLLGGGMGAIYPHIFIIIVTSLIGSIFVTYGISTFIISSIIGTSSSNTYIAIHLLIFLPLLIFGIIYQMKAAKGHLEEDNKPATASSK